MKSFLYKYAFCLIQLAVTANADEISMAFGERIPPYVFPEKHAGIELSVMREALAHRGHLLRPQYFPLARVPLAFKRNQVRAAMTDLGEDMTSYGGFYGNTAVTYRNVFITLKRKNLTIKSQHDLHNLKIEGFQGALKRYPTWLQSAYEAENYNEINDQAMQILDLFEGQVDVVLSDHNIFKYFMYRLIGKKRVLPMAIQIHDFARINPRDYRPVFDDPKVRNDFNEGLAFLRKTGRYQAIYRQYLRNIN